jgi:hypothetical protein
MMSRQTMTGPVRQWIRPRSVNGRWKRAARRTQDDLVVPAGSFPSLRARLARVRGIPLLEATPTCAEGGDKEAHASLGYEASASRELDGEIEIDRTTPVLSGDTYGIGSQGTKRERRKSSSIDCSARLVTTGRSKQAQRSRTVWPRRDNGDGT